MWPSVNGLHIYRVTTLSLKLPKKAKFDIYRSTVLIYSKHTFISKSFMVGTLAFHLGTANRFIIFVRAGSTSMQSL